MILFQWWHAQSDSYYILRNPFPLTEAVLPDGRNYKTILSCQLLLQFCVISYYEEKRCKKRESSGILKILISGVISLNSGIFLLN
jgi:hypothetical protein